MMKIVLISTTTIAAISELIFGTIQTASAATLNWQWSYGGSGVSASGTFLTNDTPNVNGFYQITGITGTRNGIAITGLYPTGTSIPGNAPFNLDNLISLNPQQLTGDGFGYSTADGNYVNPFFASYLQPVRYREIFSAPPFTTSANFGAEDSELDVNFSASIVNAASVPEPITVIGSLVGASAGVYLRRRLKRD